jgi:putative ABC transport system permease protein
VRDSLYVAWKYVRYNRWKTIVLVACIALITSLPLALRIVVDESERQLMSRATDSPLVVGAKGSALDLVMNTLYFAGRPPEEIRMGEAARIDDSGLAQPIPVFIRFKARGSPIVGTTLDYLDFRKLRVREGRSLAILGDCVLGASVAERLRLGPGDTLVSSPENLFDLAGAYPLKMNVAGVLEPSRTPDDLAVFVDLKSAWIMAGLGHGHQDLARSQDPTLILERDDRNVTANAKLREFTEIDAANLDSFHFHGDRSGYPVTAVIAVPRDPKSRLLLMGRYESASATRQIVKPTAVIEELLANIFEVERIMEAGFLVVGLATALSIVLVFVLSLRLRQGEIATMFKLGCSRMMIGRLMAAEIFIILLLASGLTVGSVAALGALGEPLVRLVIAR